MEQNRNETQVETYKKEEKEPKTASECVTSAQGCHLTTCIGCTVVDKTRFSRRRSPCVSSLKRPAFLFFFSGFVRGPPNVPIDASHHSPDATLPVDTTFLSGLAPKRGLGAVLLTVRACHGEQGK